MSLQVADFGMSRDLADDDYYYMSQQQTKIPAKWTAPEVFYYKKYSSASDVWSFGCLMYEVWSLGHKPFEKISNLEVVLVEKDQGNSSFCTCICSTDLRICTVCAV